MSQSCGFKIRYLFHLCPLLLVTACDKPPAISPEASAKKAFPTNSDFATKEADAAGTVTNSSTQPPPSIPWAILRERPIDSVNKEALVEAMSRNAKILKMAEQTAGMVDDGIIGSSDWKEISGIVQAIEGFEPSRFGGWIFKFGSFTEVVIPGKLNMLDYNLYLVRYPGQEWILVSAK